MIRRYSLAVVGAFLLAGLLSGIVYVAPWTLEVLDGRESYVAAAVMHKAIGALGALILLALVGFMALGERLGLIEPPKSDVTSLFGEDRLQPPRPQAR